MFSEDDGAVCLLLSLIISPVLVSIFPYTTDMMLCMVEALYTAH